MSELQDKINTRIKKNSIGAEYEEAFRISKRFGLVLKRAVLGDATKDEIEKALVEIQGSLEIVKTCANITTETISKGVDTLFGVKAAIELETKTKEKEGSSSVPKSPTSRQKKK